jgi:hypothetical protein
MKKLDSLIEKEELISLRGFRNYKSNWQYVKQFILIKETKLRTKNNEEQELSKRKPKEKH